MLPALLCVALAFVPMLAMVGMMQRATLALITMTWLLFLLGTLVSNPKRGVIVALGMGLLMLVLWPKPMHILDTLIDKTRAVGWNTRGAKKLCSPPRYSNPQSAHGRFRHRLGQRF